VKSRGLEFSYDVFNFHKAKQPKQKFVKTEDSEIWKQKQNDIPTKTQWN